MIPPKSDSFSSRPIERVDLDGDCITGFARRAACHDGEHGVEGDNITGRARGEVCHERAPRTNPVHVGECNAPTQPSKAATDTADNIASFVRVSGRGKTRPPAQGHLGARLI